MFINFIGIYTYRFPHALGLDLTHQITKRNLKIVKSMPV